jgi:hypothetical protein
MADNDKTLPEKISEALNTVEEFTGVNVQKATAQKAGAGYIAQQAAALGLAIPLSIGGPATISQEQPRRPDENLPSQSQHTNMLEGAYLFDVAVTTGPMIQSLVPPAEYIIVKKSKK